MSKQSLRILVVDDEAAMREVLETRLQGWGHDVRSASSGNEAQLVAADFSPDVVISDLVLPDLSGLDLIQVLRMGNPTRKVFLITAYGTIDNAVEAMKRGAVDFLTKPLDYPALKHLLETCAQEKTEQASAIVPPKDSQEGLGHDFGFGLLIGQSPSQIELYDMLKTVSAKDATVLIVGESGVGKELVAQTIHQESNRQKGPFIAVNSAAIPEGMTEAMLLGHVKGAFTGASDARAGFFEQADGGTLFLDEITELPIALQSKFLRVLEDRKVRRIGGSKEIHCDVRIVAATNRNPEGAVREGHLREDLYYRLNVFRLDVPALRDRPSDIPLLAMHFVHLFNEKYKISIAGISEEALSKLTAYAWPGNVRELRNVMERAVILAKEGRIDTAHLPGSSAPSKAGARGIMVPPGATFAEAEKILILETLKQTNNNKAEAARRLGLDVKTIRNRLKAFERGQT